MLSKTQNRDKLRKKYKTSTFNPLKNAGWMP